MFKDIDTIDPQSGRILKEDNSVVNMADTIAGALDPLEGFAVYNEMQHSIHKGEAFGYSANGTLTNGASLVLLGRVGAKQAHFDGLDIDLSSGGVLVELIEAPTVSSAGTLLLARRKNRAIGTSASNTMIIYSGATITGGAVIFDSKPPLVSGQGNSVNSAKSSIEDGWILKQNTDYSIRITNQSGASVIYNTSFGWHESSIILS